ncbi:ankyrin repeat domain-containing protein [bacterium]|nr:MAG: ankyrin repeat domain-containing protein [bacterium]
MNKKFVGLFLAALAFSTNAMPMAPATCKLFEAAKKGDVVLAIELIKQDADVNAFNVNNKTLLHFAAQNGYDELTALLLKNGAEVSPVDVSGFTPLHYAACEGHTECVRALTVKKADVNAIANNGATPLNLAITDGYKECVEILLAAGANPILAPCAGTYKYLMPEEIARKRGHEDIGDILLKACEKWEKEIEDTLDKDSEEELNASIWTACFNCCGCSVQ